MHGRDLAHDRQIAITNGQRRVHGARPWRSSIVADRNLASARKAGMASKIALALTSS
jgi:hypothetical protein